MTLSAPAGPAQRLAPASVATGTIQDDEPSVITVANASASEGGNLVFTVSRTLDSEDNQTVSYAVSNGSAESGDYDGSADALTGTVTFAPGQLSQTVTIHSVEDSLDEGDETVTVTLSAPAGGAAPPAPPRLPPAPSWTTTIGDHGCQRLGERGRRPGVHGLPHLGSEDNQTVSYAVSNGTAESGDYDGSADALTGTVTFAPGQLSQTVTIHSVEDSLDEGDETVTVTLSAPTGRAQRSAPTSVATGTILDDDHR